MKQNLILHLDGAPSLPASVTAPILPEFTARETTLAYQGMKQLRTGFSVDFTCQLDSLEAGRVLLDTRNSAGQGLAFVITDRGTIEIILNDSRTENRWDCDAGLINIGQTHHLTTIIDGGPHIISFVVDGILCDGGTHRQYGWGRFSEDLRDVDGSDSLRIGSGVTSLRIYDRALLTAEAIANYQALA